MIPIVFLGGLLLAAPEEKATRRDVVLSTDIGAEVDDQWALAHLALSPRIRLVGVVTTHAPGLTPTAAAEVANALLDRLDLKEAPPVIAGSAVALDENLTARDGPGARFLLEVAKNHDSEHRLAVVMIGAATDVASALKLDPTWADRVDIVAMAFDAWPEGGDPWNVKNDVRAWRVVLESRAPLVVGDSAVTRRHLAMTAAKAQETVGQRGKAGKHLAAISAEWIKKHGKLAAEAAGHAETWIIWDEVTTAYLLGMTTQETRPRPRLREDRTFDQDRADGEIRWITAIDDAKLWDDLARILPDKP